MILKYLFWLREIHKNKATIKSLQHSLKIVEMERDDYYRMLIPRRRWDKSRELVFPLAVTKEMMRDYPDKVLGWMHHQLDAMWQHRGEAK